ncbi:adenylate kinase-domain-containing protein, partial [Chytriomyces sp. MP71]
MQDDAREYFERKDISLIMESIMTGLVFEQPDDPLTYIESCVKRLKQATTPAAKPRRVHWDAFIPTEAHETIERRKERAKVLRTNSKVSEIPLRPNSQSGRIVLPPVNQGALNHPNIIFVLGGPGSGKGTQCEKLAKEFNFTHLSTGDLLRAELEKGTSIGKKCDALMNEGKIVPMDIILGLLLSSIESNIETPGFLIDGFPRAMDQAMEFEKTIGKCRVVLCFTCPLNVLEQRLIERGKTSGRGDDNMETIKKRFQTFEQQSMPVIDHFKADGRAIIIDSMASVDEVYKITRSHIFEMNAGLFCRPGTSPLPPISSQTKAKTISTKGKAWENIVFVLGGPGCGKGTQCLRISQEFKYIHLSAGDLLRAEVARNSPRAKELEIIMKDGKIVPMEVTLNLLKEGMEKSGEANGFLIDGFPRQLDQAIAFENTIGPCKFVLMFDAPENILETRLLKRGETSGRADDNIQTIKKRFKTFLETSVPVITHYENLGRCVKISSIPHPDEVYQSTRPYFMLPNVIMVLGGPGSGKGTQCSRLAKEFHLTHLSTGDLLRLEVERGTEVGKQCAGIMKEGKIVPMETILGLLKTAIESHPHTPGFLIDGFPRAMDQAVEFEKTICPAKKVLFFNCPLDTLEKRLIERGKTSGRADDNIDTIRKRFKTFQEESLPVVGHFGAKVLKIDSTGTVDDV